MSIYQLYYTRKGRQEAESGWGVWGKSEGVSNDAIEYFAGVKANEVAYMGKAKWEHPSSMISLETDEHFAYFMNSDYAALSLDGRGNMFFHGYTMSVNELFHILKEPEKLLGFSRDMFQTDEAVITGEEKGVKRLPLIQKFKTVRSFERSQILEKFELEGEKFRKLMQCVYGSIVNHSTLCIVLPNALGEFADAAMEILYCIYSALPYDLRIFVNFATFRSEKAYLHFSPEKDSEFYYDLTTGEGNADYVNWESIPFADVCISEGQQELFQKMNDFIEKAWKTTSKRQAVTMENIQIAYDAVTGGVALEDMPGKLAELLEKERDNHESVLDDYAAWLVESMLEHGMSQQIQGFMKQLVARLRSTKSERYNKIYGQLFVVQYCEKPSVEAFKALAQQKAKSQENYDYILQLLLHSREEFLYEYYKDYIFNAEDMQLQQLMKEYEQMPGFTVDYRILINKVYLNMVSRCIVEEIKAAKTNGGRYEIYRHMKSYLDTSFSEEKEEADKLLKLCRDGYWKLFRLEEFRYEERDIYQAMATQGSEPVGMEHEVRNLVRLTEDVLEKNDEHALYQFAKDGNYGSAEVRRVVIHQIRDIYLAERDKVPFNLLPVLHYSPVDGTINFQKFVNDLRIVDDGNGSGFGSSVDGMRRILRKSELLRNEDVAREVLLEDAASWIKRNKKQNDSKKYILLECLMDCFNEKSEEYEDDTFELFSFMSAILAAMTFDFAIFLGCKVLYMADKFRTPSMIGMVAAILLFIAMCIISCFVHVCEDEKTDIRTVLRNHSPESWMDLGVLMILYLLLTAICFFVQSAWLLYVMMGLNIILAIINIIAQFVREP